MYALSKLVHRDCCIQLARNLALFQHINMLQQDIHIQISCLSLPVFTFLWSVIHSVCVEWCRDGTCPGFKGFMVPINIPQDITQIGYELLSMCVTTITPLPVFSNSSTRSLNNLSLLFLGSKQAGSVLLLERDSSKKLKKHSVVQGHQRQSYPLQSFHTSVLRKI